MCDGLECVLAVPEYTLLGHSEEGDLALERFRRQRLGLVQGGGYSGGHSI